jgi:hypothetical protein
VYVTDIPVMDRLTDPTWRELWPAFAAVEDRLTDLVMTAEDMPKVIEHSRECGEDCGHLAGQLEGLSEATEGALWAREYMAEALAVIATAQHAEVDGMLLDLYSAQVMVQIATALNDKNRERLEAMPLQQAHSIAFKLANRAKQ